MTLEEIDGRMRHLAELIVWWRIISREDGDFPQ
jgi:hypothetical protein